MKQKMNEVFGCKVFNDKIMREKLPKNVYISLKKTINEGTLLDSDIAEIIACAMKDWAIELGATHYCHWFIPMTGSPAEKHNSFLNILDDQQVLMEFSGKNLIKGESDASSFPSGGLRATFEARGYTAWDCSSPAFIKDDTLCIPTVFCSYNGEALDKKTPLLRSMNAINVNALRILRALGDKETVRVYPSVGAEQEYFLVDEALFNKRLDLKITGKTLFGAMSPKGQEMDDHYYGNINERVSNYMIDLDYELWSLGITSKTKHNEVAPSQHELAPIHENASIACDHNHLTMEVMKRVAIRHDMHCLLNEKPFEKINGSGKHVNYSLVTNKGVNLFKPKKDENGNKTFLLFIAAVIRAIDLHADLLRLSVASAGNDGRLGQQEAPPAIISAFLGQELTDWLHSFSLTNPGSKSKTILDMKLNTIPTLIMDNADRNRTSPFAFTGDKFEFRMPGSAMSISEPCIILNTTLSESLDYIANRLENCTNIDNEIQSVICDIINKHDRIIFNGDGYSAEWLKAAHERNLPEYKTTTDVLPVLKSEKNIDLFDKFNVFTAKEMHSRYEMYLERYLKVRLIEAKTMLDMSMKEFYPSFIRYINELIHALKDSASIGLNDCIDFEKNDITELADIIKNIKSCNLRLSHAIIETEKLLKSNHDNASQYVENTLLPIMQELRSHIDNAEIIVPSDIYPVPCYTQLLFSTNGKDKSILS